MVQDGENINVYLMQWVGNITKGGKYPGVLTLLNPWIQLGMLSALSLIVHNGIIPIVTLEL